MQAKFTILRKIN